jgi:hypothetical protein
MPYSEEQADDLTHGYLSAFTGLHDLMMQCAVQGDAATDAGVREQLLHGAGRRISVLTRSLENLFTIFPPLTTRPLPNDVLLDVQINLHAFVINLHGVFDNWAWAFVLRHGLLQDIGRRESVSLFKNATRRYLPASLRDWLLSERMTRWHTEYLKTYRDALAHRIPLYIPPKVHTPAEHAQDRAIETEKRSLMRTPDWDRINKLSSEQERIGGPCFTFLHSFSETDPLQPILLHPQVVSDNNTVVEFGQEFLGSLA